MNRDEVDRILDRLRGERDRITSGLLDLESQTGYRLLKDAPLTGRTEERWSELSARTASLWRLFDAYERVLGQAEELRARRAKPDQAELAELARLLRGTSVELPAEVPLERRTLLGPSAERLSLDDVVARMTEIYAEAARTIASVDTAWSALLARLEEVARAARDARELLASIGPDPEIERIDREIERLREIVRTDPLSIGPDAFTGVGAELRALRARLDDLARLRSEYADRTRRVEESVALIRAAEAEARQVRDRILAKIATPALPDLPETSVALADRLAALGALHGRWGELADRLARLEEATATALDDARTAVRTVAGLLERRDELRGRLDAYRAKAGRLGHAEDAELTALYQHAYDLLWTSPCDLRRATVALAEYQRAIGGRQ